MCAPTQVRHMPHLLQRPDGHEGVLSVPEGEISAWLVSPRRKHNIVQHCLVQHYII